MDRTMEGVSQSPELTPRKFKFTRQEGRSRRTRLLTATRELLRETPPDEINFAMVCERADIPRASAYHFFPNLGALFLGLRIFHMETMAAAVAKIDVESLPTWQNYIAAVTEVAASVTREDPALMRLVYGVPGGIQETRQVGKTFDSIIARATLEAVERHYQAPTWPDRDRGSAITLTIIDAIFRLSFRETGDIAKPMIREAADAAIAYLLPYMPARPGKRKAPRKSGGARPKNKKAAPKSAQ
ncbi:MAG: TetR/AcrR family transcriptional regulator [Leptospirales bacterium]|jgi:AcrR family transcriptional regulator